MNVRQVPIGMYGAVMGLAGLGLSARSAATVLPGYVRAPAYVTEPWVALGLSKAGWLIIMVGGIVAPGPGIALGHAEASRFIFGISAAAAPILLALLFYRAIIGVPLPERLRPSWFVLLVPPSLIYANGIALYPGAEFLEPLYFFGLVLALALLLVSRNFLRWPFGPPWWAFTFPLDALAYAAAR